MSVIGNILAIIGAIDLVLVLAFVIYTTFFGSVEIFIDIKDKNNSDAV